MVNEKVPPAAFTSHQTILGGSVNLIRAKNNSTVQTVTRCQQLQMIYQTTPHAENIYWPKWGTGSIHRYDFFNKKWVEQENIEHYAAEFLFFSSICHLPKGLGMFILGGSDQMDAHARRATLFSKYHRFIEKPPMIDSRAFFPSIFCISDSCVYVLGGSNEVDDLAACEKYSVQENVWRKIAPMRIKRNAASIVAFDRVIFVFGGNNN